MSLQGKKSVKILKMPDGRYMKYDNTNYKYAVTGLTFFSDLCRITGYSISSGLNLGLRVTI